MTSIPPTATLDASPPADRAAAAAPPAPPSAADPPRPPADGEHRGWPPPPLRVALVLAFVVTVSLGVARVHERVRSYDDFRVDLGRVRVAAAPSWMPPEEARGMASAMAGGGSLALDDPLLPATAATAVARDPRVADVVAVRRLHPDGVEVMARLRRPVALVRCAGDREVAVDADGVHVPGHPRGTLPVIRHGGAVPRPGDPFPEAVREAASVVAACPEGWLEALGLLDVEPAPAEPGPPDPGAAPDPGVRLHRVESAGRPAVTVEWGRGPASRAARLDPAVAVKVARLRLAVERFPDLRAVGTVRLRYDELVVQR